ncbi:MAG: hypothetical protein LUE64_00295 [Candidatus Gastranaerophilales bacterium]|nr:hypothetical protein [Candidatus Gastranaerophilales bacterium]
MFFTSVPSLALDVVYSKGQSLTGRITMTSDGLIKMKTDGGELSLVRAKNSDYYGDYVKFKPNIFSSVIEETNCRVIFVDFYSITIKTPDANIKIPRYRIESIIMNTD